MIMEEKKKAKRRFNLLDAAIILVVIAVLAFVAYKMMPTGSTAAYEQVTLSFYAPDVPDYVAEQLLYRRAGDRRRPQRVPGRSCGFPGGGFRVLVGERPGHPDRLSDGRL